VPALRILTRALWVGCMTLLCGLAFVPARRSQRPGLLRWYFEACGGGIVKIGQLLASRYDLLPAVYCDELGALFDNLRPVPTSAVRFVVERELGRAITELFETFDDVPIATASLAQVHGATLPGGERVVVKVLKPFIRRTLYVDATVLRLTGRVLDALPVLRGMDVRGLVDETARTALAELELTREARNTSHMHRLMAADRIAHYAPKVHRLLSSPDVLTMERIQGVSVRSLLRAMSDGDQTMLSELSELGITPERTAIILLRSVLEQTIRYRTFNADPHPSNLIVMAGGTLAWVDFGLTGWIDERQWALQLRLREAFVNGSPHAAYLSMLESIEPIPQDRDLRAFEQDVKESIRDYILANEDPYAPLEERSAGLFLLRTIQALRRSRLPVTISTVALYRTILIADMVVLRLYPSIDWIGHLRRFIHDYTPDAVRDAVAGQLSTYGALQLASVPGAAAHIIDWVNFRLPQIGRSTLRTFSLFEQLVLTTLKVLRAGAVVGAVLIGWTAVTDRTSVFLESVSRLTGSPGSPWPGLAACVIVFLVLNSMVRRSES
jgi:ubiquinone biosynthesis protein